MSFSADALLTRQRCSSMRLTRVYPTFVRLLVRILYSSWVLQKLAVTNRVSGAISSYLISRDSAVERDIDDMATYVTLVSGQ